MKKLLVIIALLLVSCQSTGQITSERSVVIGGLFEQTGFASFAGEASRNGFLLALEDSDANIPYVVEDGQSDMRATVSAVRKLTAIDHATVVIGPEWAEFGEITVPIAEEQKTLFISPWQTVEANWSISPYYVSGTPSERSQLESAVAYMAKHDQKKVALVYTNSAWPLANVPILKEAFASHGMTLTQEFVVEQDATDFRTILTKMQNTEVDAVFVILNTDDSQGLFNRQYKQLGLSPQIYVPFSRVSPVLLSTYGEEMADTLFPAPKPYAKLDEFAAKYAERYGKEPSAISAAAAYDMTTLTLQAIQQGATSSEDIRVYFMSVKEYEGYSGIISFNVWGQVIGQDAIMKQITENGTVVVAP